MNPQTRHHDRRPRTASTAGLILTLALAFAAGGCESSPPGAGFTNPNAGSAVESDKAAERTDLQIPSANTGGEASGAGAAAPEAGKSNPSTATK